MRAVRDDVAAAKASVNISLGNVVSGLLGAMFFAFYARVLTVTELGILAAITLTSTVFQNLGQVGLNKSANSLISSAIVSDRNHAEKLISGTIILSLVFALIAMVPAFVFASLLSQLTLGNTTQTQAFQIGAILAATNAVAFDFDGIMQGTRNFTRLAYSEVAGGFIRIGVSLILFFIGYRVPAIIIGLILGPTGLASTLIQLPAIIKRYRLVLPSLGDLREILRASLPLYGNNTLNLVAMQLDLTILIGSATTIEVGVYSVVFIIARWMPVLIYQPIQGSLVAFMAKIAEETGSLERALTRGTRYMAYVCIPSAIGLAAFSRTFIFLLAGPKYQAAALPLAITMLSMIPYGFSILIWASLQALGKNTAILKSTAVGITAEAIVGLLLIPYFGPVGAAASRLALYVTSVGASYFQLRALMPTKIDRRALGQAVVASSAYLLVPLVNMFWRHPIITLLSFILSTEFFILSLKVLRALNPQDIKLLTGSIPGKLGFLAQTSFVTGILDWLTT